MDGYPTGGVLQRHIGYDTFLSPSLSAPGLEYYGVVSIPLSAIAARAPILVRSIS